MEKIVSVDPGVLQMYYSDIEIDIISLYKGEPVTRLRMENPLKSGCGVNAPVNSVWLIYADKTSDGSLAFGECSDPIRLDQPEITVYDDKYKTGRQQSINRTFKLLNFLKGANLSLDRETDVYLNLVHGNTNLLKGFEEPAYHFSAFELSFDKELQLDEIKVLKEFNNRILAARLKEQLTQTKIKHVGNIPIEKKKRRFLVLFFFYPPEEDYQSFLSNYFY